MMELVISSRLKHGDIVRSMNERDWNGRQTAEFLGITQDVFYALVNLRRIPKKISSELELNLWDLTGKTLKELFPEDVLTPEFISMNKKAEVFIDAQLVLSGKFTIFQLQPGPEEAMYRKDLPAAIVTAMKNAQLKPREQQVLYMRFFQDQTYEKIGEVLGVTKTRVGQVEQKALRKLRHPRASRALNEFMKVLGI